MYTQRYKLSIDLGQSFACVIIKTSLTNEDMTMKAANIRTWIKAFKLTDWPQGVLDCMDAAIIKFGVFVLREKSGIPMWPSSKPDAHIRPEGNSRHSTKGGERLSDATDMHVKTHKQMVQLMGVAESIEYIGGIGIYFDTSTPLIHIDGRPQRLVWIRTDQGEYVYRENDPVKFYHVLSEQMKKVGL